MREARSLSHLHSADASCIPPPPSHGDERMIIALGSASEITIRWRLEARRQGLGAATYGNGLHKRMIQSTPAILGGRRSPIDLLTVVCLWKRAESSNWCQGSMLKPCALIERARSLHVRERLSLARVVTESLCPIATWTGCQDVLPAHLQCTSCVHFRSRLSCLGSRVNWHLSQLAVEHFG